MPGPKARQIAPGVQQFTVGRGSFASNVYFVESGDGWVLVDAGWPGDAAAIETAAASSMGAGVPPAAILLTHIHPDHSGAAGALARAWGVPVYVHERELPMAAGEYLPEFSMPLDRWVVVPLLRLLPARLRRRTVDDISDLTHALEPGGRVPALADWEWIHAPGHTPGCVAFLRRRDGVLISGDAVLTVDLNSVRGILRHEPRLAGPPRYTTWNWSEAQRTIAMLARLRPRLLAPGHGAALPDPESRMAALTGSARDGRRKVDRLLIPLGNPGAERYRPPPRLYARLQWLGHVLTRLGLSPGYVVTLEVPGRRSGLIRRTSLVLAELDGQRFVVSLTGESEWVRNVRAAGGRVVLGRQRRYAARLVEVPPEDRAPIIRAYELRAGRRPGSRAVSREARADFGVGPELSLDEIAAVADRFPLFRVLTGDPATDSTTSTPPEVGQRPDPADGDDRGPELLGPVHLGGGASGQVGPGRRRQG
jgi:deazaflavin-dependent oxidoreductase (nitroreductase family)